MNTQTNLINSLTNLPEKISNSSINKKDQPTSSIQLEKAACNLQIDQIPYRLSHVQEENKVRFEKSYTSTINEQGKFQQGIPNNPKLPPPYRNEIQNQQKQILEKKVYIGNLNENVKKEELSELLGLNVTPYVKRSCQIDLPLTYQLV